MTAVIIGSMPEQVQVDEKFRMDFTRTFKHPGDHTIQTLTVTVETLSFEISSTNILDYAFATEGSKTISVTAVHSGSGHPDVTKTFSVSVVTEANENLFSKDSDIINLEPDLLNYLPEGKAQYIYVHREAQDRILAVLDERGITDTDGNRIAAAAVKDIEELNDWSKFLVLQYIFESLSNAIDDIFHEKAMRYREMVNQAKSRTFLRLDYDGDGTLESTERGSATSGRIYRR